MKNFLRISSGTITEQLEGTDYVLTGDLDENVYTTTNKLTWKSLMLMIEDGKPPPVQKKKLNHDDDQDHKPAKKRKKK